MRGSGGPNVVPFNEPSPIGAAASQMGLVSALHPLRQRLRPECGAKMKSCEPPPQPISRSEPLARVESSSSSGPPSGFWQHTSHGGCGSQIRVTSSRSFFGLPLLVAVTMSLIFPGIFLPFLVTLIGTTTLVGGPQTAALRSVGRTSVVPFGILLTLSLVSGPDGVHPGTLVWFGQSATLKTQTSFGTPSVSHGSAPSLQMTILEPYAPVTSSSM